MVESFWLKFEEQYDLNEYTIKEWDTSFSILNWMAKQEWISDKFKSKINTLVHKYKELSNIQIWDKISLLVQDDNQIQVICDTKKWKQIYIINLVNNTISSLDDNQNEVITESKWWLNALKQWILKELSENLNSELENIRNDIMKFLLSDKFTLKDNNIFFNYQNILYSPKYENNKIALEYRKVIDVLTLPWDVSEKDAIDTILKVFADKNITKLTKIKLAKHLKETFFWYLTTYIDNSYIPDAEKWVKIVNELTKRFPKYNFDNFVMVSDPEWWEVIYTNIK